MIIICFSVIFQVFASSNEEKQKLGLVLSGGGAKGFAHIGVLKVLEEEQIPVSLIAGTSMGNIIGALYSIGYTPDEIEAFVKQQDWQMLLTDDIDRRLKSRFKQDFEEKHPLELVLSRNQRRLSLPAGLVKGNNILNTFCDMTAMYPDSLNFSELPIPFACVAYDLESAEEVVIDNGYLPKAILSSMAIPGIFSPVKYNDKSFVDGGVINNFPVDVALNMGADIVIGVDLKQEDDKDNSAGESITTILRGIVYKLESQKHDENLKNTDVVINPDLKGITPLDFDADLVDTIIARGERAAREQLPQIKKMIQNRNIIKNNNQSREAFKPWLITEIELPELHKKEKAILLSQLNLPLRNSYTIEQIAKAVKRVYGYGNFETVSYRLLPNEQGYTMELLIDNKKETLFMIGGALNTVDIASVYLNYSYRNYSTVFNLLSADAKISINPQLLLMAETNRMLSTTGLKLRSRFNKMDYHDREGNVSGKMRAGSITASLYTYRRFRETADLNIGIDEIYFHSNDYYRSITGHDGSRINSFYTTIYSSFTVDSRNKSFVPDRGFYLNTNFTLLTEKGDFKKLIPIADLRLATLIPLSDRFTVKADFYHRSVFSQEPGAPFYSNYSANQYNAFTNFYFPVLGQGGVTFLNNVSTLGDLGLRFKIANRHFIIPRVQLLWQLNQWDDINFDTRSWSGGFSYQHRSRLSRLDFTIGFGELMNRVNFHGGIGYQF